MPGMSSRARHTGIDGKSRAEVRSRDGQRCVWCGRTDKPVEMAHFISRAQSGLGIPQNLISLCAECHREYDGVGRRSMQIQLEGYLRAKYRGWDRKKLVYRRW